MLRKDLAEQELDDGMARFAELPSHFFYSLYPTGIRSHA
jgi:hypothetical protein